MKYYIHTFGCQMNKHDSERISGNLMHHGHIAVENMQEAALILVNTCYVRERAMKKVYGFLGRLKQYKQQRPDMIIAVCGCGAQGDGKAIFTAMPWVDIVSGPQELQRLPELIAAIRSGDSHIAALDMPNTSIDNLACEPRRRESSVSAWVTIMEGCNNFCSYCVVPYVRGRERSRPSGDILAEVNDLVGQGYREVTLLGQNVNSWRDEAGTDFPSLLGLLARESAIARIRFITSHPKDLDDRLIEAMATLEPVCEYLHLPIQSGSDSVLHSMNRRYSVQHYLELITKIRQAIPHIALSTDIIVGYPGETRHDFLATRDLLASVGYDTAFIFYYQERSGTKAAGFCDDVPRDEKLDRLANLVSLQNEISLEKQKMNVGTIQEVLVEGVSRRGDDLVQGRTRSNRVVNFSGSREDIGHFRLVRIEEAYAHSLRGVVIENSQV